MADNASILSVSAQGSKLALELYKVAATTSNITNDFNGLAKTVSNLSLAIKQVGSLIVEDDRIPSPAAISILEHVLDQSQSVFKEIRVITSLPINDTVEDDEYQANASEASRLSQPATAKLHYLASHIDLLRATLSVILQTLYTAQVIVWTRTGPSTSPQQATSTINNQKAQLEALFIEQQSSFLIASRSYEQWRARDHDRQIDFTSLVPADDRSTGLELADIYRYQVQPLIHLTTKQSEDEWLAEICGISGAYVTILLNDYTLLHRLDEAAREKEREARQQKRWTQQASVESDSEDQVPKIILETPMSRRSENSEKFPSTSPYMPIPVPNVSADQKEWMPSQQGSANIPRNYRGDPPLPAPIEPVSPIAAAAAVKAKDDAERDTGLGIPWTLRTREYFWQYIDDKIIKTDNDKPSDIAYSDKGSWTEISLSWICKEALREANLKHTQMQKLMTGSKRTVLEPCFRIERALTFDQVQQLVEHTVEIYRQDKSSSTRQQQRRSFAEHMQASQPPTQSPRHRQSVNTYTGYSVPPPTLGRSTSLPGPAPSYPPNPRPNPHVSTTYLPIPPNMSTSHLPMPPQFQFQPGSTYPPFASSGSPQFQQYLYQPHLNSNYSAPMPGAYTQPQGPPPERRRSTKERDRDRDRDRDRRDSGASDSDDSPKYRKHRTSSSKSHHTMSKKSMKRMGTLATVGGLAALLEGL